MKNFFLPVWGAVIATGWSIAFQYELGSTLRLIFVIPAVMGSVGLLVYWIIYIVNNPENFKW